MTPTGFADAVPPFNPLKITNGGTDVAEAPPDPGPVQDDAEVTFRVARSQPERRRADFRRTDAGRGRSAGRRDAESADRRPKAASQSLPPQLLLMRTSRAGEALRELSAYATVGSVSPSTPFASIEVRMIPGEREQRRQGEPRTTRRRTRSSFRCATARASRTCSRPTAQVPRRYRAILAAFGVKHGELPVGEGQKIILLPEEPAVRGEKPRIARISVYADDQLKATVAITDSGAYKPVTLRTAQAPRKPQSRRTKRARTAA